MQFSSKWRDDLIGCPSQCYGEVEHEGKKFTLYLRWRHSDPWQGHVVADAPLDSVWEGEWSPDLFSKYDYFFREDDNLDKIKFALMICAEQWLMEVKAKK
jgi:hypothetical protein